MNFIYEYMYRGLRSGMVEDGSVGARSEDEGNKTSSTAELPQDESDDDGQSQHPSGDDSEVNVPSSPTQLSPIGNTNMEEWMDIIQERIMNRMKKEFVEEQEQEEETRRVRLAKSTKLEWFKTHPFY
jgi:hypothetical protein